MRRIKLKNSIRFFNEILKGKSLISFSKKVNINYSTLKQWRRGELLIPENKFYELLKYSKDKAIGDGPLELRP